MWSTVRRFPRDSKSFDYNHYQSTTNQSFHKSKILSLKRLGLGLAVYMCQFLISHHLVWFIEVPCLLEQCLLESAVRRVFLHFGCELCMLSFLSILWWLHITIRFDPNMHTRVVLRFEYEIITYTHTHTHTQIILCCKVDIERREGTTIELGP